jgi:hypothetical protein
MTGAPNARTGLLTGSAEYAYVATEGLLSMPAGASVRKPDGSAVGYLTGGVTIPGYLAQPLGTAIARAQRRTRLRLSLMSAPLA